MKTSLLAVLIAATFAVSIPAARAQFGTPSPAKQKLIKELLEVTESTKLAPQIVDAVMGNMQQQYRSGLTQGLKSVGKLTPERQKTLDTEIAESFDRVMKTFRERFAKEVDFAAVVEQISTPLYDKYFSEDEIKDLIAFYKTATGKKTLQVMPQLMGESMQRSAELLNPKITKLLNQIMIDERAAFIASDGKTPPAAPAK